MVIHVVGVIARWAYTGSGEGATSRKSTRKSCSALETLQEVALLLPGTFFSVVAVDVNGGSNKRACGREVLASRQGAEDESLQKY